MTSLAPKNQNKGKSTWERQKPFPPVLESLQLLTGAGEGGAGYHLKDKAPLAQNTQDQAPATEDNPLA